MSSINRGSIRQYQTRPSRNRRRRVRINLNNCHNKSALLLAKVANKYGWEICHDPADADIIWSGNHGLSKVCKVLVDDQRVNLFPRLKHCCSKAVLSHQLNLLANLMPDEFNFFFLKVLYNFKELS